MSTKSNDELRAITLARKHLLDVMTMGGQEPPWEEVWSALAFRHLVDDITPKNFRAKLCFFNCGIRNGHVYSRPLGFTGKPRKRKVYKAPEYKPTVFEIIHREASKIAPYLKGTLIND